ncbi:hypothetical protein FDA94_26740 [Herbidospora galbida]|uniref:Uncharacterized protein n=1 Tax=Herbidospora galbida TaxID=2575442 RepID=A0A4U3MCB4_9ACTN|nr:hypothetical protein [Herbidospora galbida]TKK85266.1 hypothetical protein FDA94_26740 [Herbidospora galbida]
MSRSNLLQAAVTVLVALLLVIAALLYSQASGDWQTGVRQHLQRSAAVLEHVRHVYADEAPAAMQVSVAEARARHLGTAAGSQAAVEAEAENQFAWHQRQAHAGGATLLAGDRYRLDGLGYDVPRRLGDLRASAPRVDPEGTFSDGDATGRLATWISFLTIPLVVVYLVAQLFLRRRADSSDRDVGLAPEPDVTRRFGVTLAVGVWIVLNVVAPFYAHQQAQEQRAQALAAIRIDRIETSILAGQTLSAFRTEGRRTVLALESRAAARQYAALGADGEDWAQTEIAAADAAAVGTVTDVVARMTRSPAQADGVDPVTRAALAGAPGDWQAQLAGQLAEVDRAERAGQWANVLGLAGLLAGLAATLAALAEATGQAGRAVWIRRAAIAVLSGLAPLIVLGLFS